MNYPEAKKKELKKRLDEKTWVDDPLFPGDEDERYYWVPEVLGKLTLEETIEEMLSFDGNYEYSVYTSSNKHQR